MGVAADGADSVARLVSFATALRVASGGGRAESSRCTGLRHVHAVRRAPQHRRGARAAGHSAMGGDDVLGLPDAERFVVLLVDGLGRDLLRGREQLAPFLAALCWTRRPPGRSSPASSTTATSVTSLGTGLTPGQRTVADYTFRFGRRLLNALLWEDGLDGLDVQPQLTAFERLGKAGVRKPTVTPTRFRGTGLTSCALRRGLPGLPGRGVHRAPDRAHRAGRPVRAADAGLPLRPRPQPCRPQAGHDVGQVGGRTDPDRRAGRRPAGQRCPTTSGC